MDTFAPALDHIGFNASDVAASRAFFLQALSPLAIGEVAQGEGWTMLGRPGIGPDGHHVEAVCHASEA